VKRSVLKELLGQTTPIFSYVMKTVFIVEATSFEELCLWEKHHTELDWVQLNPGWSQCVGYYNKQPIMVHVRFSSLCDRIVAFYEDTSRIVHRGMIRTWLEVNFTARWDNGERWAHTDAMNFHHCIHALKELKT
jgi:hypothetical protein